MKIAIVTPGFSADERDNCIPSLRELVRRLAASDEVHVFSLHHPPQAARYRLAGAQVHALAGANRGGLSRVWLAAAASRRIVREHRAAPFDVVHAFWADEPGLIAVRAGGRLDLPVVVSLMGGELAALPDIGYGAQLGRFARHAIDRAFAGADWCTAGSQSAAARLQKHDARTAERITVVPLGVDIARFHPEGPTAGGGRSVLHVASLTPVKDQHTLLRAFAIVRAHHADVILRVIGDGPLRGTLEQQSRELGIASSVHFVGEIAHGDLPPWYRSASLCVLASRHESQSVVALEAAGCGVATLGTAVGLIPEIHPELAVAVGDYDALASALRSLLDDPARLRRLGAVARTFVERAGSIEQTADAHRRIYECVIRRRRAGTAQ